MTLDHEALRELAVAYAFDTLTDAEAREFEPHLRTCEECRSAVRDATKLADGLALVPEHGSLPPGLRERVLQAVSATPQDGRSGQARTPSPSRLVATWLAIAATIVMIVAVSMAWTSRRQAQAALTDAARERRELGVAQQALARERARADEAGRGIVILAAADLTHVRLAGQAAAPQSSGQVFWSPSQGLLFIARRLPALPQGRVYQLWYVTASAPVSAGLVEPDSSGQARLLADTAVSVRPTAFALTIEPAGGVPAPTGAFYLLGAR
jgi:hypothetical protein